MKLLKGGQGRAERDIESDGITVLLLLIWLLMLAIVVGIAAILN